MKFYFSSSLTLDIDVFFHWRNIDQSKIKHTKKLKEIPSSHLLENLPEKASMFAFIHLKLIGNLQGFCQYIMADMLSFTIANYGKYSALLFPGPGPLKLIFFKFSQFSTHPHIPRVCGKLPKVIII